MNYILVAYFDKDLKSYFLDARNDLKTFLNTHSKNILNNMSVNCNAQSFLQNCIVNKNVLKNYIFYTHGNENSILDEYSQSFIDIHTALPDYKVDIFYSVACETAKGSLKEDIIKNSNYFFGYNDEGYIPIGSGAINTFMECENYCIKEMISNNGLPASEYLQKTETFFRKQIEDLTKNDYIVEAALLMHNKEAMELH